MDSPKFPIVTLADMARIPIEALPRFLDELPRIIERMRPNVAFIDQLKVGGIAKKISDAETYAGAVWIDDDEKTGRHILTALDPDGAQLSRITIEFGSDQ